MDGLTITLLVVLALALATVLVWTAVRSRRMPHDPPNEETRREVEEARQRLDRAEGDVGGLGRAGMG